MLADLLRILIPGVILGFIVGWIVARRPVHIRRLRPRYWLPRLRSMGTKGLAGLIAISLAIAAFSILLSLSIGNFLIGLGLEMYSPEEFPLIKLMDYPAVMLLALNLLPVVEEWIFRGIVMDEVRRVSGSTALAVIISTIGFAAFHLSNPGVYLPYLIPLIPCSVLLCLWYLRAGLGGAIVAHCAYNTLLYILSV